MNQIKTQQNAVGRDLLQELVNDFTTQKQQSLMQMKKGQLSREAFLAEAASHIASYYPSAEEERKRLLEDFEQYIFGYSRLSGLIDDKAVSDIRVVS